MRYTGKRYEVRLTWKDNVALENNYAVAKAQLMSLQSRLSIDETLRLKYQETLQTHLEKSNVKPVVFSEPQPERVCLITQCVIRKSLGNRRVANAASSFRGQSLKDNRLSGPDLLQNLFFFNSDSANDQSLL